MVNNVVQTFTEFWCCILSFRFDARLRRAWGTMAVGEYTMVIFRVRYEKVIESVVLFETAKAAKYYIITSTVL